MKKSNVVVATALSLCLSFSVHASLTSEAMDVIRLSLTSSKKEVMSQAPEKIRKSTEAFSKVVKGYDGKSPLESVDSLILIKKPTYKGNNLSPGLILRKGLYKDYNNAADVTWIGVVLTKEKEGQFHILLDKAFKKAKQENPMLDIQFIEKRTLTHNFEEHYFLGNANNTNRSFGIIPRQEIFVDGKEMVTVNIRISKNDSLEDVLELINILDNKIELPL